MGDLLAKENKDNLSCFMVTYPSTHGVYESNIRQMCEMIHNYGGLVYMDGANMNAQVGLTSPARIGADVCHLNLHKTFAIPHGGGGPGVGPICVKDFLAPYLPGHPVVSPEPDFQGTHTVAAAPWGSALVYAISYSYIRMLGNSGLTESTKMAILNANYLATKLREHFDILYAGKNGLVAHEFIIDCHKFKQTAGIEAIDIAKRLMDYGFHAPTVAFPVHDTLMVEPTESESKQELDRFASALISIRQEIADIEKGNMSKTDNPLKNAPHTQFVATATQWKYPYTREQAVFPLDWIRENKFFPSVGRVNDAFGDRNLICTCVPIDAYR